MKVMNPEGPIVAVCGAGSCDRETGDLAREIGRLLGSKGAVLICGGLGGVMAAAAEGARESGGLTIGLLPGVDREEANPYIDLALPTGLGHARNTLIVLSGQVVIALPGGPGTLSEIALGLKMDRPVIGVKAWKDIKGVQFSETPLEAVTLAFKAWSEKKHPWVDP